MKLRLLLQGFVVLLAISAAHVSLNVPGGWKSIEDQFFGIKERKALEVGFLPVT